jgi:REP element-mobilizing transposase RayT
MPHSFASILVHLVFSTKDRRPLIQPEIEPELYPYLATVCRGRDCPSLAIDGTEDHVHLFGRLGRRACVAAVVEEVKTTSSKWIKAKGPAYADFYWQAGYGAFSIGESSTGALKRYIANQKEHHRKQTFQDEFRTLLRKYRIEYNERYIWE